jgi:hypothetical protein
VGQVAPPAVSSMLTEFSGVTTCPHTSQVGSSPKSPGVAVPVARVWEKSVSGRSMPPFYGAAAQVEDDPHAGRVTAVPAYPFLSDEWIVEARRIREEHAGTGITVPSAVRMNQVITDVPFGAGTLDAHLDTTSGELVMELGHLENPDVTVMLDYDTARAIFVEGTAEAGMQAFMAGRIRVLGDFAKLVASLQLVSPDAFDASEVQRRIKEITA